MKIVPSADDPLERFLADACDDLEARVGRAGRVRDFHDVMLRAHRIDPGATPIAAVREAAGYAPVIALPRVATAVERRPPRRSVALRPGAWLGLAATLLLGLGVGAALDLRQARRETAPAVQQFVDGRADPGSPREATLRPAAPVRRARPVETPPVPAPPASEAPPTPPAELVPTAAAPARADEYMHIERAADVAWRRGDRRRARALFAELTRAAAPPRVVEAAYGDLGVLLRQDGDDAGLARLWRRYLHRFPRGRFADDARAELCRADGSVDCWTRYLDSSPDGAHRGEARRRLSVMLRSSQVTHIQTPIWREQE